MLPAISIQAIDDELEKYPPRMAWDYLLELNANPVLGGLDAWRDGFPTLLKKYRSRLFEPIEQQKELTEDKIIFQFRFPKRLGKVLIVSMLRNEHLSILSFLKSYRKLYKPRRMNNLNK